MKKYSPVLLLLLLSSSVFADSAVQTDWSGGDGVQGPVTDWGNQFHQDTFTDWHDPGSLVLDRQVTQYLVEDYFDMALFVIPADMDGDGDIDIVGTAMIERHLRWWENTDGLGITWVKHLVCTADEFMYSVASADFDGDGDMDLTGSRGTHSEGSLVWWENTDGSGTSWNEHFINNYYVPYDICAVDMDQDDDMDILAVSTWSDVAWHENADGSAGVWTEHIIDNSYIGESTIHPADLDGDGDLDVLGASMHTDKVTWWTNVNGQGTVWTEHTVADEFLDPADVCTGDFDEDGDLDVLSASHYLHDVVWWENDDGSAMSWTIHVIEEYYFGANDVFADDLDSDGDTDILAAAEYFDDVTWWENVNGSGDSWVEHLVAGDFEGPSCVCTGDLDGNDAADILAAAGISDEIAWWDISCYSPAACLESSILDTESEPNWDYIEWSSITPAGTFVAFQVRAADDYSSMGVWSDTLSEPGLLDPVLLDGNRYLQYRLVLGTSVPWLTPRLDDVMITWDPLGTPDDDLLLPEFLPISPNPATGSAVIEIGLPEPSQVRLTLFDLSGRVVEKAGTFELPSGYSDVRLNTLLPGVYICRMTTGDFTATQRFVVIE